MAFVWYSVYSVLEGSDAVEPTVEPAEAEEAAEATEDVFELEPGRIEQIGDMLDDDLFKFRESKYAVGSFAALNDDDWWLQLHIRSISGYANDHFRNYLQKRRGGGGDDGSRGPVMFEIVTSKAALILQCYEDQLETDGGLSKDVEPFMALLTNRTL